MLVHLVRLHLWLTRVRLRRRRPADHGQATTEYALVMLGAGLTYVGAIRRPPAVKPPAESQWRRRVSRAVPRRRARPAAPPQQPEPPPRPPPSPPEVPSGT